VTHAGKAQILMYIYEDWASSETLSALFTQTGIVGGYILIKR